MKPSPIDSVRELYRASAASYAALMDSEIDLPVYDETLGRWWRSGYATTQVTGWVERAGFVVDRCVVEPVPEMPMDAIYLEATKGRLP
jgi:hypothetical protein